MRCPRHPFDLTGRVALVTGGGGGLGFAIAEGLARAGARVVLNGRNRDKLDAAAKRSPKPACRCSVVAFDVTDEAAVAARVADIERADRRRSTSWSTTPR